MNAGGKETHNGLSKVNAGSGGNEGRDEQKEEKEPGGEVKRRAIS